MASDAGDGEGNMSLLQQQLAALEVSVQHAGGVREQPLE